MDELFSVRVGAVLNSVEVQLCSGIFTVHSRHNVECALIVLLPPIRQIVRDLFASLRRARRRGLSSARALLRAGGLGAATCAGEAVVDGFVCAGRHIATSESECEKHREERDELGEKVRAVDGVDHDGGGKRVHVVGPFFWSESW